MSRIVVAADLGGTNLRMAAVREDGEILTRSTEKTPASRSSDDVVKVVSQLAECCASEISDNPFALALAVPGTIPSETGKIARAPNIPGLDGFDLKDALEKACGLPVLIENDANAAAVGESWIGASSGSGSSIMMTLGTGVGGGIILEGQLVRGLDGTAGEIGHICVEPDGPVCGCGSNGCLEQFASASALIRSARSVVANNPSIDAAPEEIHGAEFVYEAAVGGAVWAQELFDIQGFYLGLVLAGLINSLNPEVVVIGGGAAAAWDRFIPSLTEQVKKRTYASASARARIVRAALGDNAGILGAARLGFQERPVLNRTFP